jgi:hypothetical protein
MLMKSNKHKNSKSPKTEKHAAKHSARATRNIIIAAAAFALVSCAALLVSFGSKPAEPRGALPPVYAEQTFAPEPIAAEVRLPEPEPTAEPTPDPRIELYARAAALLDEMTVTERVYQLFFVTPEVLTGYERVYQAGKATQTALAKAPVGGLLYSSINIETDKKAAEMLTKTQGFSEIPLFLAADGSVENAEAIGFNAASAELEGLTAFFNPPDLAAAVAAIEDSLNDGTLAQGDIDEGVLQILTAKIEKGIIE